MFHYQSDRNIYQIDYQVAVYACCSLCFCQHRFSLLAAESMHVMLYLCAYQTFMMF